MPRPSAITAIGGWAVLLGAIVLLGGCAGLEDDLNPDPTFGTPSPAPSEALGPWTSWARDLGFDPVVDSGAPPDPVVVRSAIDGLTDGDLEEWNDELRAGGAVTMRLASWLWAGADEGQVQRLHELMPRLEPRVLAGSSWRPVDLAPDTAPQLGDVHQGRADDCWLMAGLGAIAHVDPEALSRMVTRNENGTWTVTWRIEGIDVPITVSPYLPADDAGNLVYAHDAAWSVPNWSSMFEKAHAALPRFGSYARLAGGSMVQDTPVTVAAAMASVLGPPSETSPARDVTLDRLRAALEQGRPVAATTFLTGLAPAPGDDEVRLIDRHVYVVESVTESGDIVLRNPWGVTTTAGPEVARVTIEELNRRFLLVTFGTPAG